MPRTTAIIITLYHIRKNRQSAESCVQYWRRPGWRNWQTCLPAGRRADSKSMIKCFVYAIKSLTKNYIYVGLTNNTERRINQHQKGKEKTTRPYRPFMLILIEEYPSRIKARKREKYLKSGVGKEFLKSIKSNF
ncbi:MAG: GIY-YIG nuclease family protein [Candidatus Spechtbacterales bacterium]